MIVVSWRYVVENNRVIAASVFFQNAYSQLAILIQVNFYEIAYDNINLFHNSRANEYGA